MLVLQPTLQVFEGHIRILADPLRQQGLFRSADLASASAPLGTRRDVASPAVLRDPSVH